MLRENWKCLTLSFIAGAAMVLAFAPFEIWPIAFISLSAFFYLNQKLPPKAAFFNGLAFGYGVYGFGVSWVYVSLATYGGMPFWMGSIAVLGFAGILALFYGLAAYVITKFFPTHQLIAWPFIWVVFEWFKSWVLTGFPWLDLAYTQTPTWLMAWAPIGGVYLVSFIIALISVALLGLARRRSPLLCVPLLVVLIALSWGVDQLRWSEPIGEAIHVGVVQANVPINQKWQSGHRDKVIADYRSLSEDIHREGKTDLIIWPETALPLYMQQTNDEFWNALNSTESAVLTGIMDSPSIAQGNLNESYNAAVLNCAGEQTVYRKRHLVPFGEYLPLRFLFDWVLDYLELPMSDFSSWQGQQNLDCGDLKIGLSICYEDAFADEYRRRLGQATMLVNISEDAWFGDSFAPHQRRQMAQMRAAEMSRPMVRSANSGPSLFIDERGALLGSTPQFSVQTMRQSVQPHTGSTPYVRFGNWIIYLSFLALLLVGYLSRKR